MRNNKKKCQGLDNAEKIGLALRSARLNHGLSLQDVSNELNISTHFLSKLEAGQFFDLPGSAYVTGFLRSYARLVDLDAELLIAAYNCLSDRVASPNFQKMPMMVQPLQRSAPAIASMIVVLAGIVYGFVYFMNDADVDAQNGIEIMTAPLPLPGPELLKLPLDGKTGDEELAELDFDPLAPKTSVLVSTPSMPTKEVGFVSTQGIKSIALPKSRPDTLTRDINSGQNLEQIASAQPDTLPSPEHEYPVLQTNAAIAKLRDPALEVTITAVAASWVEIIRSDGETVMAKLMRAGESYVVDSSSHLYLSTGNAGGIEVGFGDYKPRLVGKIGEIIKDMPLVSDKLLQTL